MPPASAGTATSEADQNRIAPVPGKPERFGADGHGNSADGVSVRELIFLAGLFVNIGANFATNSGSQRARKLNKSRN
jgi:hypothetical protein